MYSICHVWPQAADSVPDSDLDCNCDRDRDGASLSGLPAWVSDTGRTAWAAARWTVELQELVAWHCHPWAVRVRGSRRPGRELRVHSELWVTVASEPVTVPAAAGPRPVTVTSESCQADSDSDSDLELASLSWTSSNLNSELKFKFNASDSEFTVTVTVTVAGRANPGPASHGGCQWPPATPAFPKPIENYELNSDRLRVRVGPQPALRRGFSLVWYWPGLIPKWGPERWRLVVRHRTPFKVWIWSSTVEPACGGWRSASVLRPPSPPFRPEKI